VQDFWLNDYAPQVLAAEARRYPAIATLIGLLDAPAQVIPIPIPLDCRDGFNEAYYGRPERLLDPAARLACSAWSFVPPDLVDHSILCLRDDLATGAWDRKFGHLRTEPEFHGSLRLILAQSGNAAGISNGGPAS
jgi:hypothetical protein